MYEYIWETGASWVQKIYDNISSKVFSRLFQFLCPIIKPLGVYKTIFSFDPLRVYFCLNSNLIKTDQLAPMGLVDPQCGACWTTEASWTSLRGKWDRVIFIKISYEILIKTNTNNVRIANGNKSCLIKLSTTYKITIQEIARDTTL